MPVKENKAVKQLKKQLDKLKMRIDEMDREIKGLEVFAENADAEQAIELPRETVQQALTVQHFSEEEVEAADEMTWGAEEFADIQEEEKEIRKRKKKKEGKN